MLLRGDGNCAEVQWQLMGLSMPGWVMVSFIGFAVLEQCNFYARLKIVSGPGCAGVVSVVG